MRARCASSCGIAAFAAFGNTSVERLFKCVSFFLYGVYALFVIFGFQRFGDARSPTASHVDAPTRRLGRRGITYASYNIIGAVVILPVLRHLTSNRDAVIAGCSPVRWPMIPAFLFFLCMVAFYPDIGAEVLPADFMLRQMGLPLLHVAFQLMIFAALLESGVSAVHAINERIAGVLRRAPRSRLPAGAPPRLHRGPARHRHLRRAAVRPRRADREGLPRARLDA